MNDGDRTLAALAATQRQVFTRAQALEAGLTPQSIGRRLGGGLFVRVGPRALCFAGTTLDWRGRLQAAVLDLGEEALVSGRAAAALHGLDGFAEGPVELLVPTCCKDRTTGGRVRSSPTIGRLDQCTVDGLPVTSGTRTIIELLGRVTRRELGNAIDSATRLGLTAPIVLERRLGELGRQGRRGVTAFDCVMQSAGVQSWLEREFLQLMAIAGIRRPVAQRIYRRDGRHLARVDFDYVPAPLVVEVGGRRGYLSADDRRRQEHRRNELQLIGKTIYFFTTEDVVTDPAYVVATVRSALSLAA
jgi:hypothetical protein